MKFSGLAFEMLAFLLLGVYGGIKLDEYFDMANPVFTIIGSLFGCAASMIYVIRKLPKD